MCRICIVAKLKKPFIPFAYENLLGENHSSEYNKEETLMFIYKTHMFPMSLNPKPLFRYMNISKVDGREKESKGKKRKRSR